MNLFIAEASSREGTQIAATANSVSPAKHAVAIESHSQAAFLWTGLNVDGEGSALYHSPSNER